MIKKLSIPLKYISNHPLTKNNKWSGFYRFISWQLKATSKPKIISWMGRLKLSVSKSMHGATGCIYVGLPEFKDMSFLLHFLKEDDFFMDIGANVGVYSLLASGLNKCNSISIEPIPQTFQNLKQNLNINNLTNKVSALNIGLSKQEEELYFTNDGDTVNHVVNKESKNTTTVKVDTLDNIFPSETITDTLLKIDVEGFEYNVLKGGESVLKNNNVKAIIIELNGCSERYGLSDGMVDELLIKNGFEKYDYDPYKRTLSPISAFHTEENTLYLRQVSFNDIEQKLKSAKAFTVLNNKI
ncbi:MAG: FkbM family methyltransferase [Vicingaceae bacterium]|nr:FkbM family methyltransferase [Vicingaceae bacterium]